MKLPKTDPAVKFLRGTTLSAQFALPDSGAVAEAAGASRLVKDAIELEWQDRLTNGFNLGTQYGSARVITELGYPEGIKFDSVVSLIGMPEEALLVGKVFWEALEDTLGSVVEATIDQIMEVLEQALGHVLGAMVDIVSGIPVYGWAVKIVWNVVRGIMSLVDIIRQQNEADKEPEVPRLQFSPDGDLSIANQFVLGSGDGARFGMSTLDWTSIFMPPGVDKNTTYGEYFLAPKLEGGGRRIQTRGEREGWVGMIPGTTSLHQFIEIEPGGVRIRDTGSLFPTARNFSAFAWAQSTDLRSPTLYSISARQARDTWAAYLFNLRMWIRETNVLKESTKRKLVNSPVMVKQFGWGPYDMPFDGKLGFENFGIDDPNKKLNWKRVPESAAPGAPPAQTGVAHPIRALRELEGWQRKGLDTLQVAYVDEDQGAFKGFKAEDLAKLLETRRKQLLQHPALCDVNLADVVDPAYKSAVDFHQEMGEKGEKGYPDCRPASMAMRQPGSINTGPFKRLPITAQFNPVPSDAPQYIDAVVLGSVVNGAKKRKREGRPTFIQEYGAEVAAAVGFAAAAGALWRYRGRAR